MISNYDKMQIMTEDLKRKHWLPEGIEVEDVNAGSIIGNIPNDGDDPFVFALMIGSEIRFGDAVIDLQDPTFRTETYLPPITFRSEFGGSHLPCIAEELNVLFRAFESHGGKIPSWYKRKNHKDDKFPNHLVATLEKGKTPEDSRYIIRDLQDDDEEDGKLSKFLDIEITKDGNAIVTQKFFLHGRKPDEKPTSQRQMIFKTAKNGGKFPIMAEVFTRIAERIAKAKDGKV